MDGEQEGFFGRVGYVYWRGKDSGMVSKEGLLKELAQSFPVGIRAFGFLEMHSDGSSSYSVAFSLEKDDYWPDVQVRFGVEGTRQLRVEAGSRGGLAGDFCVQKVANIQLLATEEQMFVMDE